MILDLPTDLMTIPYNEAVTPEVQPQPSLADGCNCQVFAYAVLKHFGVELPPFRSSNLCEDDRYT